jgi:hypothetical protein
MTLRRRKSMINEHQTFFEYKKYPEATVVALNAALDDFKGFPVVMDGKEYIHFKEKTVKDCTLLDGCVYLHLGHVDDAVMCDLIEKFKKLMNEQKEPKNSGRLILDEGKIII